MKIILCQCCAFWTICNVYNVTLWRIWTRLFLLGMYSHLKHLAIVGLNKRKDWAIVHTQATKIELIFMTHLGGSQNINLVDGSTTIWTYFCTNIIQPSHSTLEKDSIHHWGDVTVWKAQMFESENRCQKLVKAYVGPEPLFSLKEKQQPFAGASS